MRAGAGVLSQSTSQRARERQQSPEALHNSFACTHHVRRSANASRLAKNEGSRTSDMKRGAEFSVFQGGSPPRKTPQPVPDNLNLRKQRSLGNLVLLSDGEQRVYTFELDEPSCPPSATSGASSTSPPTQHGRGGARRHPDSTARARSLSLSLTKVLSQSEHSLIPVPWGRKSSRMVPAHHHQRPEAVGDVSGGRKSDEDSRAGSASTGGDWAEELESAREEQAQLDKEVILTMLGDLEQVLSPQKRRKCRATHKHTLLLRYLVPKLCSNIVHDCCCEIGPFYKCIWSLVYNCIRMISGGCLGEL